MIYYDIQHHGHVKGLLELKNLFWNKQNFYNFSIDSTKSNFEEARNFFKETQNTNISRCDQLSWAGPSLMLQMAKSLENAVKIKGWEYFVNLSGTCIPLMSQKEIFNEIKNNKNKSFCFSFEVKKKFPYYKFIEEEYIDLNYFRLKLSVTKTIHNDFINKHFDPVRNAYQRNSVYCEELEKNYFRIRGLKEDEITFRKEFFEKNKNNCGRQWVIIHKSQVEEILQSERLDKIITLLRNSFLPDEYFYPLLLFSKENKLLHYCSRDNLRYENSKPNIINRNNINNVVSSGSLFARKFDYSDINFLKIKNH